MGHCVQAIVAPFMTADEISNLWPELPRLNRDNGFSIFPVEAELIDTRIAPDKTPTETGDEFILLTDGFRRLLRSMSHHGQLAYVETEYFGASGGQGALAYRDGSEVMPPTWHAFGTINDALKLIGVKRSLSGDQFDAAGFGDVRDNDDILDLIAARTPTNDA
jgi:hypothetical protein